MRHYFTDRNVRRLFVLVLFLGVLWFFRHLFLLFVFFVIFERTLSLFAGYLSAWTKLKFKYCLLIVLVLGLAAAGGLIWLGVSVVIANVPKIREGYETVVGTIKNSALYHQYGHLGGHVTADRIVEQARHHAGGALHAAAEVGRATLYVMIALIFSIVFLMEREQLETWREHMPMDSVPRILLRFMGHVSDAIAITIKLQVIVAVVNAVVTIPVLVLLDLPGIPFLVAMLIVCGLIPVVGGPVAGAVLMTLAYVTQGPKGLAAFVISTFILHKIESYYLNPRLTAKHVKLPSFVIITSLILFEHAFGLIGLFLSFPCLYVAAKIREGWVDPEDELREEAETTNAMRGVLPRFALAFSPAALKRVGASVSGGAAAARRGGMPEPAPVLPSPDGELDEVPSAPPPARVSGTPPATASPSADAAPSRADTTSPLAAAVRAVATAAAADADARAAAAAANASATTSEPLPPPPEPPAPPAPNAPPSPGRENP